MIYISKLFSPISTGTAAGDLDVGATVKINENGQAVDYLIVHQGLPGDMYDASCEGTWCLRKDIAENRVWDSHGYDDYQNSDIYAYLNGDWLNRYDSDVANQIVQCKIPYVNGTGGSSVASGANGLSVKSFLLGGYEVGWTTSNSKNIPADGSVLFYFQGTSEADSKRIAYLNGIATNWFLRSPYAVNTGTVLSVQTGGSYTVFGTSNSRGIRPALILPYSFKFKEVS